MGCQPSSAPEWTHDIGPDLVSSGGIFCSCIWRWVFISLRLAGMAWHGTQIKRERKEEKRFACSAGIISTRISSRLRKVALLYFEQAKST